MPRLTLCGVGDAAKICKASADNPEMTVLGQTVAELREGSSQVANLIVVATISGPDSFDILRLFHGGGGLYSSPVSSEDSTLPHSPQSELEISLTVSVSP